MCAECLEPSVFEFVTASATYAFSSSCAFGRVGMRVRDGRTDGRTGDGRDGCGFLGIERSRRASTTRLRADLLHDALAELLERPVLAQRVDDFLLVLAILARALDDGRVVLRARHRARRARD
eukprot:31278-Pelagococcus_subviridis.AAC.4